MVIRTSPLISQSTVRGTARHGLAQAVACALMLGLMVPSVGAESAAEAPEATSLEQLAAIKAGLPDLGGEEGAEALTSWDELALLQQALSAVASTQRSDSAGGPRFDPGLAADQLVQQAANASLSQGLKAARDSGLPFLGTLQGGITYDNLAGKLDYDLLAIGSLRGNGAGHNLLGQLGAHNEFDRPTLNVGLVYRWLNPEKTAFYGGNVFYDRDFKTGAQRLGVGAEASTATTRGFVNAYAPLSDEWFTSPTDAGLEERPASGFDAGLTYTPLSLPGLDLQIKGAMWKGDSVDVFGQGGEGLRNPTVVSAKVGYKPVPLVGFSVEREKALGGQSDTRASVNFTYQFGVPMAEQLRASGNRQRNDVSVRAMAPVERENRIIMETREKYLPLAFEGEALVRARIREDELFDFLLRVTGGAPPVSFSLTGADASAFTLSGYQLTLDGSKLPSATDGRLAPSADGDYVFEVAVKAVDGRGGRAEQRFQIEVIDLDTDEDGLSDRQEGTIGTDPENPDTDGDGHLDGEEVDNGTNPLDPNDPGSPDLTAVPSTVLVYLGDSELNAQPVVADVLLAKVTCTNAIGAAPCPTSLNYDWQVEGAPGSGTYVAIPGATGETYVVERDVQRRKIRVAVNAAPTP